MRRVAALSVTAALALTATGCLSSGDDGGGGSDTVTVWTSVDQPVSDGLEKAVKAKADADGIKIDWQRVENINQLIMTKIQANDAPDIAMIPQPGVVADIVRRGAAYPLDDVVDMSALQSSMVPGTLDAGTVDGKLYGLLISMNIKSLVWYNKPAWEKAGYTAPESIDQLNALTDQMKKDGNTPWCMGIESDTATGWPATDWFEELIMKYGGPDVYNQWVTHEIPFDSDVVRQAAKEFEELMFTEGNVLGGQKAISSTNFGTAGNPMFEDPPKCWMYKQGSFITGFFPDSTTSDLDTNVGVFGFPWATEDQKPVLGGGDLGVLMSDSDNAKKVMGYLSETDIGNDAAPNSSFISPHKDFDMSLYPNEITRQVADVGYNATTFLFDGSDQMPGEVGAGSFWKEMTAWISGQQDLDTTLKNIDNSWPS
ncbi:MAG TPA: ABC transporter substrate-binding protein [Nocardioides sp.]|uniref:ABC transporter substrate-binding protein n=1 Tax=Nocardioides sp. TaxID=35761 RepID=UPI002CD53C2A|nr:ABC transporter substrate-binding protein [Nocardioides sp.]HQR26116.1 ABC transporter substrate-binding protein [Nocardioides sp.]